MLDKLTSARESLRESEEKYHQLFELVSDAIFLIDNETGNILEVNKAACELYGFTRNRLLKMKHVELSSEPEETRRVTLAAKTFVPVRWHRKKDQTIFPVEITATHFLWKGRHVHIAAIRDITDRMHAEEALRESEERYRSLIDHNQDAVYSFDHNGVFLSANDATCRISGYRREELMRINFDPMIIPEDKEKVWQCFKKSLHGEPQNYETTIICKDGSRVILNVTNTPIIVKGKIIGVYGLAKDITRSRQAEEALHESEERFQSLFNQSLDCVYVLDLEGRLIDANMATFNLLGYSKSDLPSLKVKSFIHPDQRHLFHKRRESLMQTGLQTDLHEYKIRRKDDTYVNLETVASIIYHDGRQHSILGIARDVTERKRMEAYTQQSFGRLRKTLGATIQAMAATVEIRDPYTAGHQKRVSDLARSIATQMGISSDQIDGLRMASTIHDIGKIAIPSEILSKPARLTDIEFSLIKTHSQAGYDILKDIEFPWPVAKIVLDHHERIDGSGYPNGLTGDDILIESKILMVADVVEAIASHRPYRPGLGIDVALDEILQNRGLLYDHEVVDACVRLFREKGYKLKT